MTKLSYNDGINFDIYVMDLCDSVNPKSCEDLEELAEDLHERVECAIQDYIMDSEELSLDDYQPYY